jgi:hypothetical protein
MSIRFPDYAKIKNRYCICYFGPNEKTIKQLKYLRPILEKTFPSTEVYVCLRDQFVSNSEEKTLKYSNIQENKRNFSHIRELTFNMKDDPIIEFLKESELSFLESQLK